MASKTVNAFITISTDPEYRSKLVDKGRSIVLKDLYRPGRDFLRRLVYPHPRDEVINSMPEKVLETYGRTGTSDSPHEATKASYEYEDEPTWDLVQVVKSRCEHIDAIERAFRAPGGFSVLSGLPKTGKTTVAVIQAWQAAMAGHKVLICGPTSEDVDAISNRLMECLRPLDALVQRRGYTVSGLKKVYLASSVWEGQVFLPGLLAELTLTRKCTTILDPSPEEALINRTGPHKIFHELALRLETERLSRSGPHNIIQPAENPLYGSISHIYNTLTVYSETLSEQSRQILEPLICRIIKGLFSEADIIVTSCLAASNIPHFEPTVVIVDQWDTNKDWECMIPLTRFGSTEFRSIIGNFDLPHWQQTYEYKGRLALPIKFATRMASKPPLYSVSPLDSVYTLSHLTSNEIVVEQPQEAPEDRNSTRKNNTDPSENTTESAPIDRYPISRKASEEARQKKLDCNEERSQSWDVSESTSVTRKKIKRRFSDSDSMDVKAHQTAHTPELQESAIDDEEDDETESPGQKVYLGYYFKAAPVAESSGSSLNAAVTQGTDESVDDESKSSEQTEYVRHYFDSADTASSLSSFPDVAVNQGTDNSVDEEAESHGQTEYVGYYFRPADRDSSSSSALNAAATQGTGELANDEGEPTAQTGYAGNYSQPADADNSLYNPVDAAAAQGTSEVADDEAESPGEVETEYTETPSGGARSQMQFSPSRQQALVSRTVKSRWSEDGSDDSEMHRI